GDEGDGAADGEAVDGAVGVGVGGDGASGVGNDGAVVDVRELGGVAVDQHDLAAQGDAAGLSGERGAVAGLGGCHGDGDVATCRDGHPVGDAGVDVADQVRDDDRAADGDSAARRR